MTPHDFWFQIAPRLLMEVMRKYFRLQVEGLENIPRRGPAVIAPNHSGYAGLDALTLAYEIQRSMNRTPRVLTHRFWFLNATTAEAAKKYGFLEASFQNGLDQLKKRKLIVIFPEGEEGNFKPTSKAYDLQEFRSGFVRMALATGAPIIPTYITGAEESHITLKQFHFKKFLKIKTLPLPLNILPFPSRWKIRFLKPIYLPYKSSAARDNVLVREIAEEIREQIQSAIQKELSTR